MHGKAHWSGRRVTDAPPSNLGGVDEMFSFEPSCDNSDCRLSSAGSGAGSGVVLLEGVALLGGDSCYKTVEKSHI